MMEMDDEILQDFLSESKDNLNQLDEKFVELEQNPDDKELLSSIFRIMHTLKGTSGFFGFNKLQAISHAAEDILSKLRDGITSADQETIDILLEATDNIKAIIAHIEKEKKEPENDTYEKVIDKVRRFADNIEKKEEKKEKKDETENSNISSPEEKTFSPDTSHAVHLSETQIKVDIELLDKLMNLAGELVLSRNRLVQIASKIDNSEIVSATQRLSLVTTELQEEIMKTRMQPIGTVFNKFPRIVRDLARIANKKIKLNIKGADTELDRSIIEAIKDPLTHIIRNSVDHGIEPLEDRVKAGKPAVGNIILNAYHEGGQVIIEIKDDGAGIDIEKVKKKAVEKGIITEAEALTILDKDALNLIFKPGFSTADRISNISGRGVGMDVVKTNIEKLGGSIELESIKGQGATIRMKIPLTLAIIPALIVSCYNGRYAIPQVNLKELVILNKDEIEKDIQFIGNSKFYRLRDEVIPVFSLEDILDLPHKAKKEKMSIVILNSGIIEFGLEVNEILDSEEIVVKPLSKHFQGVSVYSGATLMGDGGIALILDIVGISSTLNIKKEEMKQAKLIKMDKIEKNTKEEEQFFLIFQASDQEEYFAIPLALVARLDRIKAEQIEHVAGKEVIQYRGHSMPLIRLDQFIPINPISDKHEYDIIVFSLNDRDIAFLIHKIVDSIHSYFELDEELYQFEGILGSSIVNGHTTLFVDVYKIIESYSPEWFKKYNRNDSFTILLAEDSIFYRNLIKSYLSSFGYEVIPAKDGNDAWKKLQEHEFDIVVTDIVMPNMDGLSLSSKIRQDKRLSHIPIIAISSSSNEETIKKVHDTGINTFVSKIKLENLTEEIENLVIKNRLKKVA